MKARIGLCPERWDGVPVLVAHVVPLDNEAALADRCAKLFIGEQWWWRSPYEGETFPTLCGERCRPHFTDRHFIAGPGLVRWRVCAACAALDSSPRLP